jgi:multidrug efflux pump subunit AcrA (membrane-fusion protein)
MNSKLFQQMNTKKWLFILIILVLLGAGGRWGYQHFFPSAIDNNDYISNEMPVEKGDVVNLLMMNGKAKFSNMQKLIFPQSGKIVAVYKKVGDLVKAGEIIAKMDSYEVDNELEQAKI